MDVVGEWFLSLPPALCARLVEGGGGGGGGEGGGGEGGGGSIASSPLSRWLWEKIGEARGRKGKEEEEEEEEEEEGGGGGHARVERLLEPVYKR